MIRPFSILNRLAALSANDAPLIDKKVNTAIMNFISASHQRPEQISLCGANKIRQNLTPIENPRRYLSCVAVGTKADPDGAGGSRFRIRYL
jgi:hypothetical protein